MEQAKQQQNLSAFQESKQSSIISTDSEIKSIQDLELSSIENTSDNLESSQSLFPSEFSKKQSSKMNSKENTQQINFQGKENLVKQFQFKKKNTENNQLYVAKQIQLENDDIILKKEYEILKSLDHPNEQTSVGVIVMEYFEGINLSELIKSHCISKQTAILILSQLLQVLKYLHSQHIVHRDISLENILYNQSTQTIKLIDFGISCQLINENELQVFSPNINDLYRPPEFKKNELTMLTVKIDIFASGLVFLSLILNKPIYTKNSYKNQIKQIEDHSIQKILKKMLQNNYSLRISAETALENEIFNEIF